jgi:hypothetical protein
MDSMVTLAQDWIEHQATIKRLEAKLEALAGAERHLERVPGHVRQNEDDGWRWIDERLAMELAEERKRYIRLRDAINGSVPRDLEYQAALEKDNNRLENELVWGVKVVSAFLRSYGGDSCHMDMERWVVANRQKASPEHAASTVVVNHVKS